MLYTGDDAKAFLMPYLENAGLTELFENPDGLNGLTFSGEREPGTTRAVTVGCINITDNTGGNNSQLATLNVNVYASDINKSFAEQYANMPDRPALKAMVAKCVELLGSDTGHAWDKGRFHITGISGSLKIADVKEHYINIRVDMRLYPNNQRINL